MQISQTLMLWIELGRTKYKGYRWSHTVSKTCISCGLISPAGTVSSRFSQARCIFRVAIVTSLWPPFYHRHGICIICISQILLGLMYQIYHSYMNIHTGSILTLRPRQWIEVWIYLLQWLWRPALPAWPALTAGTDSKLWSLISVYMYACIYNVTIITVIEWKQQPAQASFVNTVYCLILSSVCMCCTWTSENMYR